jgi:NAD(P)-dependent dehydrogenase (short-subunit alcohol dehydrogenase family)
MRDSRPLAGRSALVTGASSGIGRAIAVLLARQGADLCVVGTNSARLQETVDEIQPTSAVTSFQLDLALGESHNQLFRHLSNLGRLDMLVNCAGVIRQNRIEESRIEDFDLQYVTNVRVPYLLTKRLLPLLTVSKGQVVFINSSAGLSSKKPEAVQYAATKHALRAVADGLREELNPKGIRVVSVYLGRTATPMQEVLFRDEGRPYHPEMLLQPEDVASVVVNVLLLPPTAEVTDISIRPMQKSC